MGYLDVSPLAGVGMRHLKGPKNPDGLNLGIHLFEYVYKVHMCIYMLRGGMRYWTNCFFLLTCLFFWESRRCDDNQQTTVTHFGENKRLHLESSKQNYYIISVLAIIKAIFTLLRKHIHTHMYICTHTDKRCVCILKHIHTHMYICTHTDKCRVYIRKNLHTRIQVTEIMLFIGKPIGRSIVISNTSVIFTDKRCVDIRKYLHSHMHICTATVKRCVDIRKYIPRRRHVYMCTHGQTLCVYRDFGFETWGSIFLPIFWTWYKITVWFIFRTCFACAISVRPRGTGYQT